MHIYLGMLDFEGDIITSLVIIVKSTMPILYPLYQVRFDEERLYGW